MLGPVTRFILRHLLIPGWLLATSPIVFGVVWLLLKLPQELRLIGLPVLFAWIIGGWWLGETTTRYMAEENDLFIPAVKHSLRDLRLRLVFLPLIGAWFEPPKDKRNWKKDED